MKKLKTIKDLEVQEMNKPDWVDVEELKQEAKKWILGIREVEYNQEEEVDFEMLFMKFLDIKEDDLIQLNEGGK